MLLFGGVIALCQKNSKLGRRAARTNFEIEKIYVALRLVVR